MLPQHFSLEGETPADAAAGPAPTAPLTSLPIRSLAEATRQFQHDYIRYVYENSGKVWAKTARQLEIDPGNLHRLARKLGLK